MSDIELQLRQQLDAWEREATTLGMHSASVQSGVLMHVVERLRPLVSAKVAARVGVATAPTGQSPSWKERIWTADGNMRLDVGQLAEALGRKKAYVYKHTSAKGRGLRIPHRRAGGRLVFVVGEIRPWLTANERVVTSDVPL